jgi:hypothetical protein
MVSHSDRVCRANFRACTRHFSRLARIVGNHMIPDIPDSTTPRVPLTVIGEFQRLSRPTVLPLSAYATEKYRSFVGA